MKFYNRKKELALLRKSVELSNRVGAQMSILIGRRRIGKSELIIEAFKHDYRSLYFFVSKKRSQNLLKEFGDYFNSFTKDNRVYVDWDEFIEQLFKYSIQTKTTLIFDEFQNFHFIDEAIFDIFQKYWDRYNKEKDLNIVVAGSLISLLEKLFYDSKQPLYKRATSRIVLKEFSMKTVYQILIDNRNKKIDLKTLLDFYSVFGGNPYYYNQIFKADLFKNDMVDIVEKLALNKDSVLQNEGREILIQEFGSEHSTYFSILEAISLNHTTFTAMLNFIGSSSSVLVRGIKDLEEKFALIEKEQPVYAGKNRMGRYKINNNFINFWFRYIYANQSFISSGKTKKILRNIDRDLNTMAGRVFEDFCLDYILTLSDSEEFYFDVDKFGKWWDKKGEIDLIVESKIENKVMFGECKLSNKNINQKNLEKLMLVSSRMDAVKTRDKSYSFFCADKVSSMVRKVFDEQNVKIYEKLDFMKYLRSVSD